MNAIVLRRQWRLLRPALAADTRPWRDTALVMTVLFAVTLACHWLDPRTLDGVGVWVKPLKFQASLALHFATLALLASLLTPARRGARGFALLVAASSFAALFEIGYIMLQAGRARASHFNVETPVESVMYSLMGVGSLLLVLAPFVLGVWLWRERDATGDALLRRGAALGLLICAVATLIVAGYLSAQTSHWVGGAATDAGGLPLVGWSRQAGDLRVAHFFATHAMQVLPLAALLLTRVRVSRPQRWLSIAGVLYVALIGAVLVQALAGRPLLGVAA